MPQANLVITTIRPERSSNQIAAIRTGPSLWARPWVVPHRHREQLADRHCSTFWLQC